MDFHSLTRKDLQTLCKKNKIPANITNVAMADSLKALQIVEGLDEFLNQSESNISQSPEKSVPELLQIPRTATRTSTQRKPTKDGSESSQPLTYTRHTARRTITEELYQENQDVNIPITPAVPTIRRRAPAASARQIMETQLKESEEDEKLVEQEKSGVFETPAVKSGRKRATVASSRRKVESQKEEGSMQRVYSTRRSVRLLEKNMAEMSLKEKERTEPVKMNVLDEVEDKKDDLFVSDVQTISEEVSEKTGDSEIKGEVKDDEKTDESDVLLGEYSEKAIEMNDAAVDGKVIGNPSKADNLNDDLEPVTEKDLIANEDTGSESAEVLDDIFAAESSLKQEIDNLVSGEESVEPNPLSLSSSGDQVENQENECQKLKGKHETDMDVEEDDHHVNDDPELQFSTEEESDGNSEVSDENPSEEESDIDNDADADQKDFEDDEQFETENEHEISKYLLNSEKSKCELDSDVFITKSNADAFPGETNVYNSVSQKSFADQLNMQAENLKTQMEKYDIEPLVDVNVIEAEEFAMTPQSARQMGPFCPLVSDSEGAGNIPLPKMQELDNPENLVDIYVMPEVEFAVTTHVHSPMLDNTPTSVKEQLSSDQPLLSGGKVTGGILLSPLAADSLPGQFPRPTQSTPLKSSRKKQTTIQKLAQVSGINKENIENTGSKVEPKKDRVKKNTITVDNLDGKSLRELNKMLREKLQITNIAKTNEDKNVSKEPAGMTRPALQTLPENCKPTAGEA